MLPELVAAVLLFALVAYALTGGADFGGGVWDLFASGLRKADQRALIERALAPIWEANHVWLILLVVVLFVALPTAYAAISTALHLPILAMLIGIVLRGAAFVFRSYDPLPGRGAARWRTVFAVSSLLTPLFLGVVMGALLTGQIRLDDQQRVRPEVGFISAWFAPFPFLVGAFVTTLFAWLAALYLAVESESEPDPDPGLTRDFRLRAVLSGALAGVLSIVVLALAETQAPHIAARLADGLDAALLQIGAGVLGFAAIGAAYRARYRLARALGATQVIVVVVGLGRAQWPFVIAPDLTFEAALAPQSVVVPMLVALAIGTPILLVALIWLYRVFKSRAPARSRGGPS
jgi:cytochrome d ubiquinol oxidase subunit II